MPPRADLVTVGYEGRSADDLVAELVDDGVGVLVDVRARASSRKPGFARTALSSALSAAGIRYEHRPALGNPRGRDSRGEPQPRLQARVRR